MVAIVHTVIKSLANLRPTKWFHPRRERRRKPVRQSLLSPSRVDRTTTCYRFRRVLTRVRTFVCDSDSVLESKFRGSRNRDKLRDRVRSTSRRRINDGNSRHSKYDLATKMGAPATKNLTRRATSRIFP
jgi:hypothetical protein